MKFALVFRRRRPARLVASLGAAALMLGLSVGAAPTVAHADTVPAAAVHVRWNDTCTAFTATATGYGDADTITVRWHRPDGKISGVRTLTGNTAVAVDAVLPSHAAVVSYEAWSAGGAPVSEFTQVPAPCATPRVDVQWLRECTGVALTLRDWPQGYRSNIVWYNRAGLEMGRTTGGTYWGKYNFAPQAVSRVDYFVYTPAGVQVTDVRSDFAGCGYPPHGPWDGPAVR